MPQSEESLPALGQRSTMTLEVSMAATSNLHVCPGCGRAEGVISLDEAVKRGSAPRFWASEWASLPAQRKALGGRWLADSAMAQLKRPSPGTSSGIGRALRSAIGGVIAILIVPATLALVAILLIAGWVFLLGFLALWLLGVLGLVLWARHPHRAQARAAAAYQRALGRWRRLDYCPRCALAFDPDRRRLIPIARLHDELYR